MDQAHRVYVDQHEFGDEEIDYVESRDVNIKVTEQVINPTSDG